MDDTARSRLRRQRSLSPVRALRASPTPPTTKSSTTSKSSRMKAIGSFLIPFKSSRKTPTAHTTKAPTTKPSTTTKSSQMKAIGSFLIPSMFQIRVQDTSATAKKKFQVNVPTRLLAILGLVFLLIPVFVFLYKEAHIHEDHHKAHYHAEKFVNVDSKHAMAHFLDNHNKTTKTSSNDEEDRMIHGEDTHDNSTDTHGNSTKTMLRHNTRHSFHNSTDER